MPASGRPVGEGAVVGPVVEAVVGGAEVAAGVEGAELGAVVGVGGVVSSGEPDPHATDSRAIAASGATADRISRTPTFPPSVAWRRIAVRPPGPRKIAPGELQGPPESASVPL